MCESGVKHCGPDDLGGAAPRHRVRAAQSREHMMHSLLRRAALSARPLPLTRCMGSMQRSFASEAPLRVHPYAAPQSWLGAYYTLRQEGPLKCERAIANREKRKGKNAPARGRFIVSAIEKLQIDELVKKDPWRGPAKSEHGIQSGETLEVWFKPAIDQPEERVVGYCIARHNRGLGSSFRLLCKIDQCPIEYQFQLFSPLLLNVIVRAPRRKTQRKKEKFGRLRSKLYFLRDEVDKLNLPKPTPRPRKEAAPKAKK